MKKERKKSTNCLKNNELLNFFVDLTLEWDWSSKIDLPAGENAAARSKPER